MKTKEIFRMIIINIIAAILMGVKPSIVELITAVRIKSPRIHYGSSVS